MCVLVCISVDGLVRAVGENFAILYVCACVSAPTHAQVPSYTLEPKSGQLLSERERERETETGRDRERGGGRERERGLLQSPDQGCRMRIVCFHHPCMTVEHKPVLESPGESFSRRVNKKLQQTSRVIAVTSGGN